MSNYVNWAVHPETGKTEQAEYLDDHFGKHLYGVRFSDGRVFPSGSVVWPRCETCGHDFSDHALPHSRTYCPCEHPDCECGDFVLKKNITPMHDEFLEEVARSFSGQEPRPCRGCGKDWTPSGWNFYGLCNTCFPRWDAVRFMSPAPGVKYMVTPGYYSSCDQWIADGCPDKPEEPFQIHFED